MNITYWPFGAIMQFLEQDRKRIDGSAKIKFVSHMFLRMLQSSLLFLTTITGLIVWKFIFEPQTFTSYFGLGVASFLWIMVMICVWRVDQVFKKSLQKL